MKALKIKTALAIFGLVVVAGGLGFLLRLNTEAGERKEENTERQEEDTAYQNQLIGCATRGNEMREYVFSLATVDAASNDPIARRKGHRVIRRMQTAEFANPDGTVNCQEAIEPP